MKSIVNYKSKIVNCLIIAIILVSCGRKPQETQTEVELFHPEFLKNVELHTVSLQNVIQLQKLTGKVDFDHDRLVRYVSLVDGTVLNAHFHLGDRVERGQTMAVIRSAELSQMEAERKILEAEILILQRELESVQSMYSDNIASQKDLLEAQAQLTQAEATLEALRINLSYYGAASENGAFIIRAPISGFVVEKNIATGTPIVAQSDEPLFVIADLSRVWVIANVYPGNLALVKVGMPVEITTSAYSGYVFHGQIDLLSQVFDPEERVLKARIMMPNTDLRLKPEMVVDIALRNDSQMTMPTVPTKALIFDDNRYFVVKQTDDNSFVISEVTLHAQNGDMSYIEAGLEAGDRVVVKENLLMYSKFKE